MKGIHTPFRDPVASMVSRKHFAATQSVLFSAAAIASFIAFPVRGQDATPVSASPESASNSSDKDVPAAAAANPPPSSTAAAAGGITITAKRLNLLGTAQNASDGVVSQDELDLTPAYRPGQLLETVPGLIVTLHSGEGKANQYLMRGYNLDHGTDLATFVDDVPINEPTHAHGQGYTDLNFLIPELVSGLTYTKGTYHADVGDFGGVGSVRLDYLDTLPDQVSMTTGVFDFQRLFAGGSRPVAGGNLLAAAEFQHYDGPFDVPDDQRKENLALRYSHGDEVNGYSLTGTFYHGLSTNTTDIPVRAIDEGVVPDRFGSLDPTDGVRANRGNLSFQFHDALGGGELATNLFYFHNELHLYNNFTHFLVDPIHGDQENQFEFRNAMGGEASYTLPLKLLSIDNQVVFGTSTRYDEIRVGRTPSAGRVPLTPEEVPDDPASFSNLDQVYLLTTSAYIEATTHWTPWFRSVLGFRDDYARGGDNDFLASLHESDPDGGYTNSGNARRNLPQPKGSLIFTPTHYAEFYLSAGRGFHSADLRGVNQTRSLDLSLPGTPLLASLVGEEAGMRAQAGRDLAFTVAFYNLDQQSETIIDPDVGTDAAGPASRRSGYEINATYNINRWLEFYGSYSGDHTRFRQEFDDGTGHLGNHITDAPLATGSLALYVKNLGHWSGGLEYRYLGNYPLSSGPCADSAVAHDFPNSFPNTSTPPTCANAIAQGLTSGNQVDGKGFGELNADVRYQFMDGFSMALGVYNLLDTKRNAAEFIYVDRLKSEVTATNADGSPEYPDGRADVHIHPLETIAARLTLTKTFGGY